MFLLYNLVNFLPISCKNMKRIFSDFLGDSVITIRTDIEDGSVTTADLADGIVTTGKIADGAVDYTKITPPLTFASDTTFGSTGGNAIFTAAATKKAEMNTPGGSYIRVDDASQDVIMHCFTQGTVAMSTESGTGIGVDDLTKNASVTLAPGGLFQINGDNISGISGVMVHDGTNNNITASATPTISPILKTSGTTTDGNLRYNGREVQIYYND